MLWAINWPARLPLAQWGDHGHPTQASGTLLVLVLVLVLWDVLPQQELLDPDE